MLAKWKGYRNVFYTTVKWSDYRKFRGEAKYDGNFALAGKDK
jgi:hypothetical protein